MEDMRKRTLEKRQALCAHEETVTTVTAGIMRVVCEQCGHVSVGHHHDLVASEESLVDADTAAPSS